MHLKSIELYGFKSFANKMVFKFDQGITAIVGPNGSGKSNVADAVRWVLGEQSAKSLRGSKMQDVIFAGTETRKPLGYCQVDLTIDNQDMKMPIDYSEVTVSRRVYRSGEGEYFINGTSCRMKDILELFMDTGVGQEGYSIIGQGQIDKILSNKPDERRALFDEAVGIVKFKKRKASAEKRLDDQKQNLYRINDIISELESQQGTLEKQSEKARQYLTIKEELKSNEVNVFILDVASIDDQLKELEEKKTIVEKDLRLVHNAYQENKLKHGEYIRLLEELETELETFRNQTASLTLQKEKKEGEISLSKQEITHLKETNERYLRDKEIVNQRRLRAVDAMSDYEESVKSLFEKSGESSNLLKQQEASLITLNEAITKEEEVVSTIQANMIERLNEISTIRTQMQRFQTMAENTLSRKDIIESRKSILEASIDGFKKVVGQEKSILKSLSDKKTETTTEKESLILKEQEAAGLLSAISEQRKLQSSETQRLESRHKALSEIADQYEGYNFSIKKVMALKGGQDYRDRIIGVVADVVKVEKSYETAIEIALGGNYQNIITEDEATAKSLIAYLKDNRFGRATFLPISNIRPSTNRLKEVSGMKGFIGYADELVTTDPKYLDIIRFLLGRVLVTDTIDSAIAIGKKYNNTLRIVTLTGEVVNPGGSLTGGAFKNNNTQFLSRNRELEELLSALKKAQKELRETDTKYQELLYQKSSREDAIQKLSANLSDLNIKINAQQMKLHQVDSDMTKAMMEYDELKLEEQDLLNQDLDLTGQLKTLEESLKNTEDGKDHAEETVKELMARTLSLKKEKDELQSTIAETKVVTTSLMEQSNHAKSNVDRMKLEIKELEDQMSSLDLEVKNNEVKRSLIEETLLSYREEIHAIEEAVVKMNAELSTLSSKRQNLTREQEKLYTEQESISERITLLEKDILRLDNQLQKLEAQKENYMEYMWNEYELTYNNAMVYKKDDLGTVSVIKKRVDLLKGQIKGLGDVNVNAIEEYKTVKERFTFLSEQREDILEAEAKLRQVIAELDEQMQSQFREQFEAINVEFGRVFKELFGGGKAFLGLSDDEDVLQAGIHIHVQPPGKKLQNMMLLSGGERAFTAIALLFAIQNLKPSPFCVLDEIEAALDDANVDRFANYLKKLTHNTQFIIITHRRGTMEASDALYGITMQEKGISTQVSVKLIEDVLEV